MHCRRRRLLRRGLKFHVYTINKSAHTKKVWKLIVCTFVCVYMYIYVYIYIYIYIMCTLRCLWCDAYHCKKWLQQLEFKSWPRLFTFHIVLIPEEQYESKYSSSSYRYTVKQTGLFHLCMEIAFGKGKTEFKPVKLSLKKIDLVSHLAHAEVLALSHIYIYIYIIMSCH